MEPTRIAVFVSGGGTNLQALLDAEKSGQLHSGKIVLVLSNQPGAFALQRAQKAGVATEVVQANAPDFEEQVLRLTEKYQIQLIILAGFLSILSADFVSRFPKRILNVHPSLIPSFCGEGFYGLHVHEAALRYGVKLTGATVHYVNEITDGGEILLQKAVPVEPGDTPQLLQRRVMEQAEWVLLPQAAEMVSERLKRERGE